MGEMTTLSARVPEELEERFEEYREARAMDKAEAIRRLLEKGLDASDEELEPEESPGLLDHPNQWMRSQFETFFGGVLLSSPVVVTSLLVYWFANSLFGVTSTTIYGTVLLLVFGLALFAFLCSGAVALTTGLLLFLGVPTRFEEWRIRREQEAPA